MSTVVVLLSDKRSGSTMFQRELCRHPDIRHVQYTPHANHETHHWLKGAVMTGMPAQTFADGKVYQGYGPPRNAHAYLIDCVRGNVPDYQPTGTDKELVFDAFEALCDAYARPVFFEKSPQHLSNWGSLMLLLEWSQCTARTVRFIGLTRNPMAVMHSALAKFHTPPESRQYFWMHSQKNLLAFEQLVPADSFLHCRYEDIIEAPASALREVTEFIGLPANDTVGSGANASSLEKWRGDTSYRFVLDDAVAQLAAGFGYDHLDLDNPHADPGARTDISVTQKLKLGRQALKNRLLKPMGLHWKQRR